MKPALPAAADRGDANFLLGVGAALATWGLGVVLWLLSSWSAAQSGALPVLLLPVCAVALLQALRSGHPSKREDASQILMIALAGALAGAPALREHYFGVIGAVALAMAVAHWRLRIEPAPMGVSSLFVVALAPDGRNTFELLFYLAALVLAVARFSRSERQVASSAVPIGSALVLALHSPALAGWPSAAVALVLLGLLRHLAHRRAGPGGLGSERRLLLDAVLVFFSLALLLQSMGWSVHARYALLAMLFGALAGLRGSRLGPVHAVLAHLRRARLVVPLTPGEGMLPKVWLAVATLGLALAINAWPLGTIDDLAARALRIVAFAALAGATFAAGRRLRSATQRDLAKAYALAAALAAFALHLGNELQAAPDLVFIALTTLGYAVIALALLLSELDLHYGDGAAWQTILPGRTLVKLRKARAGAVEVLTKAPLIGWMFALSEKAAAHLQKAFGEARVWTLSHYAICASVLVGFLVTMSATQQVVMARWPALGNFVSGGLESAQARAFLESITNILSILLFSAAVFLAGALARLPYLRVLAVAAAGLLLAALWFMALAGSGNPTSGWFYPLAFCCALAVFRLLVAQAGPSAAPHPGPPG